MVKWVTRLNKLNGLNKVDRLHGDMSVGASGWIRAAEMDDLIQVHFGRPLEKRGFAPTGHRRWVRSRVVHVRDVFEFISLGHSLNPRWGFSLDYCPTVYGDDLKWHRTAKGARIDVCYDPIDYVDPPSPEFHAWLLP
jgi:hypothetical protein